MSYLCTRFHEQQYRDVLSCNILLLQPTEATDQMYMYLVKLLKLIESTMNTF